jgi:hypothetical protein
MLTCGGKLVVVEVCAKPLHAITETKPAEKPLHALTKRIVFIQLRPFVSYARLNDVMIPPFARMERGVKEEAPAF